MHPGRRRPVCGGLHLSLQGRGQPGPALHRRYKQGLVKMVNAPELSLRGGRRPTWQSPATGCVFAEAFLLFTIVLRDSHVASLLGMTNLEPLRHKIHAAIIASLQGAQGTPLQTQSVHTVLSTPCTNCKCSAGSGMPFPATRHEGLTSNENIRLTAAHLMLYTDTGGPQPVRLQENPPSQKFRREGSCERLTIKSQARNAEEKCVNRGRMQ